MTPRPPKRRREWRILFKKRRRQKVRQALAKLRDEKLAEIQKKLEESQSYQVQIEKEKELERLTELQEKRTREEENAKWMERERLAQEEWAKKQEIAEKALPSNQPHEICPKGGEKNQENPLERAKQVRNILNEKLQETWLSQLNSYLNDDNGTLPAFLSSQSSRLAESNTEETCYFFLKTGACRFGETCNRHHFHPPVSNTLLIPGFYHHYALNIAVRDDFNSDCQLEYEDSDIYHHFREFYEDVFNELRSIGNVVQFKVCCNLQPHLRGNVYVQYSNVKEAVRAFLKLQGRLYDGRHLSCRFVQINSWKAAICGSHLKGKCPKGRVCNFLHVFPNPDGLFREADRDWGSSRPTGDAVSAAQVIDNRRKQSVNLAAKDQRERRWSESPPPPQLVSSIGVQEKATLDRRVLNSGRKSRSRPSTLSMSYSRSKSETSTGESDR